MSAKNGREKFVLSVSPSPIVEEDQQILERTVGYTMTSIERRLAAR